MSDYPPVVDLAGRLDQLFRDRGITNAEAAAGINAIAGDKMIAPSYLSMLRRGRRAKVSAAKLEFIAAFFGVDLAYFTSPVPLTAPSQAVFTALADPRVRTLVATAAGLSEGSLNLLVQTAARFQAAERAETSTPPNESDVDP